MDNFILKHLSIYFITEEIREEIMMKLSQHVKDTINFTLNFKSRL